MVPWQWLNEQTAARAASAHRPLRVMLCKSKSKSNGNGKECRLVAKRRKPNDELLASVPMPIESIHQDELSCVALPR